MPNMEVSVSLDVAELDGEPVPVDVTKRLGVCSHDTWNDFMGLVVLTLPGGGTIAVNGQELKSAVDRCLGLT